MGTRGRDSAASLGVVPIGPRPRMAPPEELTPEQAELWVKIAATKSPDWWNDDSAPLLVAYCQAVTDSRAIEELIRRFDPALIEDKAGIDQYDKLLAMRARHAGILATLATKMRLAQQSRYNESRASTIDKHTAAGTKPWQRVAGS